MDDVADRTKPPINPSYVALAFAAFLESMLHGQGVILKVMASPAADCKTGEFEASIGEETVATTFKMQLVASWVDWVGVRKRRYEAGYVK